MQDAKHSDCPTVSQSSAIQWAIPAVNQFPDVFFRAGSTTYSKTGHRAFFPMTADSSQAVPPGWVPLGAPRPPTLRTPSSVKSSSHGIGGPATSRASKPGTPTRGTLSAASSENQSTQCSLEWVNQHSIPSEEPSVSRIMRTPIDLDAHPLFLLAEQNFSSTPPESPPDSSPTREGHVKVCQREPQVIPKVPGCAVVDKGPHAISNQPSKAASALPQISATGRLSGEALENLADGLKELDHVIQKIKGTTGLAMKQILARWQPSNPRLLNLWNIYQKYFQTRTEEELHRLRKEDRPPNGGKAPMATIRAAYKAFQEHEPNYESILEMFWRIQQIDGSNTTLNARHGEFVKFVNAMKRLAESASTINGFEVAFCAAGSVVQQDQTLSATYCSPMVPNFFSDRLQFSDNEIEGHLKAHAYDYASRTTLRSADHGNTTTTPSPARGPSAGAISAGDKSGSAKSKGRNHSMLALLKEKLMDLIGPCKTMQLRGARVSIKEIPALLAENGWVIENWPEEVPFLCDIAKGKGLASLRPHCREILLDALNHRVYPVKITKKYFEAIPPSEPVIIGAPPEPESNHANGRRRFLDKSQTVDRKGPARRVASSRKRDRLSEQQSTAHKTCDVDNMLLKRRRKSE